MEKIDKARQNKLEGKKGLFDQPPGMGRMAGDILDSGLSQIGKAILKKKKVESVKKSLV